MFFEKMLTVNEGINRSRTEKNAALVDIRAKDTYKRAHIAGSVNIPSDRLDLFEKRFPDKEISLYLCGDADNRPQKAAKELRKMGYKNAHASGYMEDHHGIMQK